MHFHLRTLLIVLSTMACFTVLVFAAFYARPKFAAASDYVDDAVRRNIFNGVIPFRDRNLGDPLPSYP
jgi:hypothetical protein